MPTMINKENLITQEYIKSILCYNSDTGLFTWLISRSYKAKTGDIAGTLTKNGYIQIIVNGKSYYAHRLAWLYMTGNWPKNQIDHIDLIKNNNKWNNLREAVMSQNKANVLKYENNTSGIKGVCWAKREKRWLARINVNSKQICIGYFDNIENAAKAYEKAAIKYFGDYARVD